MKPMNETGGAPGNGLPRRLLIIEDDPDIREVSRLFFDHPCVQVETAPEAVAGLELAWRLEPHVVLIDLMLPRMDGIDVFRELTRARFQPRIIFMSASSRGQMADRARALGAWAFVEKPFDEATRDLIFRALGVEENCAA